ncbi:MAG: EAL domain-containing protein [Pseudobutyrivibrio sp.]|uniref:two-component system response regulator n=1 Tax=Pseudobutyrivibrio sp. TaxID=2014367 RepID=UPI0025ED6156|nr:EAL domain-containing protein [Pseudobutyrivibrio sp.]MBQ8489743.1 EAL domain-containing protein [Pseudobutyrivibrio sp.]
MNDFIGKRLKMKRRILIVDDEEINVMMLSKILKDEYEVFTASNGNEALDILKQENGLISLILLDLIMPVMDGYEFFNVISQCSEYKNIPIICLTSEKDAEVEILNMGMADFIPKPFENPAVILARISRVIQLFEGSDIIKATQFDDLTNLYNIEYFCEYASLYDKYYPHCSKDLIAISFNRFYVVNAVHGRAYSDKILVLIGNAIKDYVDKNAGVACRYLNNLFYVYIKSGNHADGLLEKINTALYDFAEDSTYRIKIGVFRSDESNSYEFSKKMDYALLACNSINDSYSTQIAYYDESIREKENFEEKLICDLDKAIEQRQFKVYYQPKFSVQSTAPHLCSAEALIRWEHPEFGMINPGKFIPLFEKNGMITKLDHYVWVEAANQVAQWKKTYNCSLPVSVNVSRIDMLDENLCHDLLSIVKEAGIDIKDFYLEVTESAYTNDKTDVLNVVDTLRKEGFYIEMDDFGTGYSSLNMLTELQFDVLKLDMEFVRNIHKDEKALRLVEFIIDIAKYLNVMVIAEGVEHEEQYNILKQLGCDVVQGYYFSKPVDNNRFEDIIKKNAT